MSSFKVQRSALERRHSSSVPARLGMWGGLSPDDRPWEFVKQEFVYVDQFETLRRGVRGAGNLDRFDFWLDRFRYTRATA